MELSKLIKELQERFEMYGDLPVVAHYEGDFNPIEVIDVTADFEEDKADFIEIILKDIDY